MFKNKVVVITGGTGSFGSTFCKSDHLKSVKPILNGDVHNDSTAFHQLNIPYSDGGFPKLLPSVSNYLPGVEPIVYPDGIGGYRVNKQSAILVKDLHFGPSPIEDLIPPCTRTFRSMPPRPLRKRLLAKSR